MCFAGSSSEPDLAAITTLLCLPFDCASLNAAVSNEPRTRLAEAWGALFDAVRSFPFVLCNSLPSLRRVCSRPFSRPEPQFLFSFFFLDANRSL